MFKSKSKYYGKPKRKYGKKVFKKGVKDIERGPYRDKKIFRSIQPYGIKPDWHPRVLQTRFKYSYHATLQTAATIEAFGIEQVFRLNSIYDANFTTIGPTANNKTVVGHVNIAQLYNRYIVLGAKVEVDFDDPSQDGLVCGCSLNQSFAMQSYTVRAVGEQFLTYTSALNNTGSQKKSYRFYVKPWAIQGLSKLEYMANKSTHSSAMNSNPTDDLYFRIAIANCHDTAVATMKCNVRIIFYTQCYERIQLSSSTF